MDQAKLEIIMFNMSSYSEWESGIANRNFHIFQHLLNNPRVERIFAIDFLPFTRKRALRNYYENIIKGPKGKVIYKDWTTKCTQINDRLYVFSTIDSIFSHQRVVEKLKLVLEKIGSLPQQSVGRVKTVRIVWSYFPMLVDYLHPNSAPSHSSPPAGGSSHSGNPKAPIRMLNEDLTVFDAVDNWIEHPSFVKYKDLLRKNYQIIAQKSDLIFTVAEFLVDFFKKLGREKDVYWIANGVELENFISHLSGNGQLKDVPSPIIGYVGTIQNRVDVNLLEYLAQKNPDKSFVLIGPLWPVFLRKFRRPAIEIRRLKKYKNIYLLGRKKYQELPIYLDKFDVAIIPHRLDEFIKYTYSLKLLEFLAAGKPVVSPPISGAEKFADLVYLAKDYRQFNEMIQKAIREDNPNLRRKRREAVANEDWSKKMNEMLKIIDYKIKERQF